MTLSPDANANSPKDDEKDTWDTALEKGGCVEEHLRLNDCYWDKHDWRKCSKEMEEFRKCWESKHEPLTSCPINMKPEKNK
ncbi:cytochrome c oxidase assembly protein Coa4 [Schizosaccharomyces osmophilus]|uniref:Cytochrome c oxidase assembly protein Coa4 n=1 Tax=Schizosaccharomyces osmophilus TaxID=2545709 RepID=A0AAE9WF29_9SCHI|nr:cytochrome c oxidase assembly protein Coa4 [Schizosaccharomyces osmophilus]WBW75119.1 cytochrome c oxidase assembly protein Coa4 [Schizosaccharomyces osmophilus]